MGSPCTKTNEPVQKVHLWSCTTRNSTSSNATHLCLFWYTLRRLVKSRFLERVATASSRHQNQKIPEFVARASTDIGKLFRVVKHWRKRGLGVCQRTSSHSGTGAYQEQRATRKGGECKLPTPANAGDIWSTHR